LLFNCILVNGLIVDDCRQLRVRIHASTNTVTSGATAAVAMTTHPSSSWPFKIKKYVLNAAVSFQLLPILMVNNKDYCKFN